MKLFVIVLCLLSERFLIHALSHARFEWFSFYLGKISQNKLVLKMKPSPWVMLGLVLLPLALALAILFFVLHHILFGFFGFILQVLVLYYCLGPQNPFYPLHATEKDADSSQHAEAYFSVVNGQLFAPIFWYFFTGIVGVFVYRLVTVCRDYEPLAKPAHSLTTWLEWIPARLTALLFLLVGNFQRGLVPLKKYFFANTNEALLGESGVQAAQMQADEVVSVIVAEHLVEQSLILWVVLLALYTVTAST